MLKWAVNLRLLSLSFLLFSSSLSQASRFQYLKKDVTELSATKLVQLLSSGKISSYVLTQAYLENIEATNHKGPNYNAVIEVNPDALAMATALDAELKKKGPRGLLHGLPVLVKDNIDTADRLSTSAGSFALAGIPAPLKDAEVIRRLRAAGAIILGKTNMDVWAAFQSGERSVSGWSPRGGLTRNPLNSTYSGCGSSTGSAASVAVRYAALALGTEANGSLICPAGFMGLVALKPTKGLVSRSGMIPGAPYTDTAGPLARTVADAALLLEVMAGYDADDSSTAPLLTQPAASYHKQIGKIKLKGLKIGVLNKFYLPRSPVGQSFGSFVDWLKSQGAEVVTIDLPELEDAQGRKDRRAVFNTEFKYYLEKYLATRQAPVKNMADLIKFNSNHAGSVTEFADQASLVESNKNGLGLTDPVYLTAVKSLDKTFGPPLSDKLFKNQAVDFLIAPTFYQRAFKIDMSKAENFFDHVEMDSFARTTWGLAAFAGLPHLTVPAFQDDGMPVGISIIGPKFSETALFNLGLTLEKHFKK